MNSTKQKLKVRYYITLDKIEYSGIEIHKKDCPFLLMSNDIKEIGLYENCKKAILSSSYSEKKINGCKVCTPDCFKED